MNLRGVLGDLLGIGQHRHILGREAGCAEVALHGEHGFPGAQIGDELLGIDMRAIARRHLLCRNECDQSPGAHAE
jgi:hypothetical protein